MSLETQQQTSNFPFLPNFSYLMEEYLQGEDHHYKTGFHGKPLIIAWLPLVNFAVLCASIKWCKYTFYCHLVLSLGVIVLTLLSTVHILVDDWLSPNEDFKIQKIHNIAGLAVTIWLAFQVISGILARVIQFSPRVKTNTCVLIKRIHHISSYLIMLVSKFNYLNIKFMKGKYLEFFEYFIIELLFLAVYLWIKSSYWTLSEEIVDGQLVSPVVEQRKNMFVNFFKRLNNKIQNVKSQILQHSFKLPKLKRKLHELTSENQIQIQNYILFNDVVYDISGLKSRHPGGQKVIDMMKKREVNRFLYGYYRPQNDHKTTTHVHTKQSLTLCGEPIAKITRIPPMKGFDCLAKFDILQSSQLSPQSSIHVVYLKPKIETRADWINLQYEGYKFQRQIGQHLSLTISNKNGRKRCTRLYTSVWCMRPSNIDFMARIFPNSTKLMIYSPQKYEIKENNNLTLTQSLIQTDTNSSEIQFDRRKQLLPLVIKKYSKGELTSRLLVNKFKGEIIVSAPMGAGMNYQDLRDDGKVIIVCGGTGVLPFCDLIDLLFKRVKHLQNPAHMSQILSSQELIKQDLIRKRKFIFYCALQSAYDILPLTFYQLDFLCSSENEIEFEVVLKIKKDCQIIKGQFKKFKYQSQSFNSQIQFHLNYERDSINKIYICGPYKMNEDMSKIFKRNKVENGLYHFM